MMTPIDPGLPAASFRIVRLLRRWAAGRDLGPARLPSLVRLGRRIGVEPQAAVALASLFQLTEACLARPLEAECCCSPRLSRDERATLLLLASPPMRLHQSFPSIPHGLPGALVWAVASVRKLIGSSEMVRVVPLQRCPFGQD